MVWQYSRSFSDKNRPTKNWVYVHLAYACRFMCWGPKGYKLEADAKDGALVRVWATKPASYLAHNWLDTRCILCWEMLVSNHFPQELTVELIIISCHMVIGTCYRWLSGARYIRWVKMVIMHFCVSLDMGFKIFLKALKQQTMNCSC